MTPRDHLHRSNYICHRPSLKAMASSTIMSPFTPVPAGEEYMLEERERVAGRKNGLAENAPKMRAASQKAKEKRQLKISARSNMNSEK